MVNEEKNLGDAVVGRAIEIGSWKYVETPLSAEVRAGDDIVLRPHWKGAIAPDEIRKVIRLASVAPSLYTFLMKIYLDYESDCACECNSETCCAVLGEPCAKCHANVALLLVDQPSVQVV